jgi:hypothetical protein
MIVLHGKEKSVRLSEWNDKRVWIAGINTPWSVIQTYASGLVIMVTDETDYLQRDMTGIYVITTNHFVAAEVVHRGGFCLRCGVEEGLWRLRALINDQ